MTGLSLVKRSSKSMSLNPCGCSVCGCSFIKSTTLTTRIFRSGRCSRMIETAASVSSVGTSPQQAITTSGATPWSLLARDHDVDVVAAAQAVVHHRQKAVGIRRKVNTHNRGLLVQDVVDETGIL